MLIWVMYDIADPRRLNRCAKICLQSGIYRVQKSVYVGELNKNQIDELRLRLQEEMDLEDDSIYMFPMLRESWDKANLMGKAFNKAMVSDTLRELIL